MMVANVLEFGRHGGLQCFLSALGLAGWTEIARRGVEECSKREYEENARLYRGWFKLTI